MASDHFNPKYEDVLTEKACFYRYNVRTQKLDCFSDVLIAKSKNAKRHVAEVYYKKGTRVYVDPDEGVGYFDCGLCRLWLNEQDDERAKKLIHSEVVDYYNWRIEQAQNEIKIYKDRIASLTF